MNYYSVTRKPIQLPPNAIKERKLLAINKWAGTQQVADSENESKTRKQTIANLSHSQSKRQSSLKNL
jgi:hypothetical protein